MEKCPRCGYTDVKLPNAVNFQAREYVNEKTGLKSIIASSNETVAANDGIWVRADLWNASNEDRKLDEFGNEILKASVERSNIVTKSVDSGDTGKVIIGEVNIPTIEIKPSPSHEVHPTPKPTPTKPVEVKK